MPYSLLDSPAWKDYALLDSGNGAKLERFGPVTVSRPEAQAMWKPKRPTSQWSKAEAQFFPSAEESGGHWQARQALPERWEMCYPLQALNKTLRFWAMTTPGRHLGVFPEMAAHWEWYAGLISGQNRPLRVLNLFGYTGLASLACAAAGAQVTHVDASKKSVTWARENQALSGLEQAPIRWIVEDALKFVEREARRGNQYEGILLDPPKFGRGPQGEVWEVYKALPTLLQACHAILAPRPLFVALSVYAVRASALHLQQTLEEMLAGQPGSSEAGELITRESGGGRLLSHAVFARWQAC